jgi:ribosomal protein L16 Arg81 hydroxylase
MEPTLEMCSCRGIEPLPLNCFEVGIKIDERIKKQEKTLKEWESIIKEAKKQTKIDKEAVQLLDNMYNDDKQELEQLKKNGYAYAKRCEQNYKLTFLGTK